MIHIDEKTTAQQIRENCDALRAKHDKELHRMKRTTTEAAIAAEERGKAVAERCQAAKLRRFEAKKADLKARAAAMKKAKPIPIKGECR